MDPWKLEPAHDLGLAPGDRLKSIRRESGLLETLAHVTWWSLVRAYLGLFHRLKIRGREHLPKEAPFLIVANHSSHLDALVLAAPFPWRLRDRVFPIAAGDTFFEKAPVAAFAAFALNALPLWRKHCDPNDVKELRRRLIEEPCAYVLFPEGTRTRTGEMGPFKRGVGMLAAGARVPVVPCYLKGAFEAFPPQAKVPRPGSLVLTIGPSLQFTEEADTKEGWAAVAAKVEAAVRALAVMP